MKIRMKIIFAGTLLASLVAGPANSYGQGPTFEEFEMRVAQTLLNTIKGDDNGDRPSQARIQEFRDAGSSDAGEAWAVSDQRYENDGSQLRLFLQVTLVSESYQPDAEAVRKWREIRTGEHQETGAEIGFVESTRGDVRRNRVYFRLEDGTLRLLMNVTRTGDESVQEAIDKAEPYFNEFVKYAKQQQLLYAPDSAGINLVYQSEDGNTGIENGHIIQAPYKDGTEVDMSFVVSALSPIIAADQPYELEMQVESKGTTPTQVEILDGNGRQLRDKDNNGWNELAVSRGDASEAFVLRIGAFNANREEDSPYALEQFVVGAIRVKINDEGEFQTIKFGVQRRSWHVIVQRLELMPYSFQPTGQEISNSRGFRYDLDGRLGFNDFVGGGGQLVENYENMISIYGTPTGEIPAASPVGMGWQRDLNSEKSYEFLVASNAPDVESSITVLPNTVRPRLVVDVKIVQAPLRESLEPQRPPSGGAYDLSEEWDGDQSRKIEGLDAEREIRRTLRFSELSITRTVIQATPRGESHDRFMAELPARLRLEPDADTEHLLYSANESDRQLLDSVFPLTNRYLDPDSLADQLEPASRGEGLRLDPHRHAGTYELRLTGKLRVETGSDSRSFDLAIRYGVSPETFDFSRIYWNVQRMDD